MVIKISDSLQYITENKTHHIVKPEIKYQDDVDKYRDVSFKSTVSRFSDKNRSFQSLIDSAEEEEDYNDIKESSNVY